MFLYSLAQDSFQMYSKVRGCVQMWVEVEENNLLCIYWCMAYLLIVTFSILSLMVSSIYFMPHSLNPFRLFVYSNLHSSHASDSLQDWMWRNRKEEDRTREGPFHRSIACDEHSHVRMPLTAFVLVIYLSFHHHVHVPWCQWLHNQQ